MNQSNLKIVFLLFALILTLTSCSDGDGKTTQPSNSSSSEATPATSSQEATATPETSTPEPTVDPSYWVPKGFTLWPGDENVAIKWATQKDYKKFDCTADWCWVLYVETNYGCPNSLYGEIGITDANGVVIDYSNDSLGSLSSGSRGRLVFETYAEEAEGARLTDLSCR